MRKIKGICLFLCLCLVTQLIPLPAAATASQETTDASAETTGTTTETTLPQQTQSIEYVDHMGANDSVIQGCHTLDAAVPLLGSEKYLRTAGAAFLYETNSDTVLYTYNPDERVYPSSLVKIMTALLAVEQGDITEEVTVTPLALSSVPADALTVGLRSGEKLTLGELLHCMMAGSANDAAVVIADHISGSHSSFVKEMNRRAAEIGCTGTNFVNAHGLHDENQYTTARDVCRIMEVAMENQQFMEYFSAIQHTVPATNLSEERVLTTTNYTVLPSMDYYYDSRITGGRTGITEEGKRCLVSAVEDDGMTYIAVVMDAVTNYYADGYTVSRFGSYEETKDLIALVDDTKLAYRQVMSYGQIVEQWPVENGDSHVAVGPGADVGVVLPAGATLDDLTIRYLSSNTVLTAPVAQGQSVSAMQVWFEGICLAQCDLVTKNTVSIKTVQTAPAPVDSQEDSNGALLKTIVVAAIILAAAVAVVLYVRSVNEKKRRAKESRMRRSQRRGR